MRTLSPKMGMKRKRTGNMTRKRTKLQTQVLGLRTRPQTLMQRQVALQAARKKRPRRLRKRSRVVSREHRRAERIGVVPGNVEKEKMSQRRKRKQSKRRRAHLRP